MDRQITESYGRGVDYDIPCPVCGDVHDTERVAIDCCSQIDNQVRAFTGRTLTITEVQAKKFELETAMSKLVDDFEAETGCEVGTILNLNPFMQKSPNRIRTSIAIGNDDSVQIAEHRRAA